MTLPPVDPDPKDGTPPDKGKTFTQDELNVILRDRLERQKTQLLKELGDAKVLQDKADSDAKVLEAYRATVLASVTERKKGLPPPVLALVEKLDPLEQLEWLTQNATQLVKTITPPPDPKTAAPDKEAAVVAKRVEIGSIL